MSETQGRRDENENTERKTVGIGKEGGNLRKRGSINKGEIRSWEGEEEEELMPQRKDKERTIKIRTNLKKNDRRKKRKKNWRYKEKDKERTKKIRLRTNVKKITSVSRYVKKTSIKGQEKILNKDWVNGDLLFFWPFFGLGCIISLVQISWELLVFLFVNKCVSIHFLWV